MNIATVVICALSAPALLSAEALSKPQQPASVAAIANSGARQIQYAEHEIISIAAKLRFTTLIRLPKGESILDFVCGDREFWQVTGVQNFAFVKPSKAGASTSLHLVTAAGTVYAFVLTEVGETGSAPDLELDISTKDTSLLSAIDGEAKFVPASAVADFKAQYDLAKQNERITKEQADFRVRQAEAKAAAEKREVPTRFQFDYRFKRNESPFMVSAIYRDDKFTYIKADALEPPAVYESKDGKPSLLQFEFKDGIYTIPKMLDAGYLQIGKKKLEFNREPPR